MFLELWDHDPSKIKHNIFLCVILCRLGFPRDVLGRPGTIWDGTSHCPFVPGQKSFLVPLFLCSGQKKFLCLAVPLSQDKSSRKNPATNSSVAGPKKMSKKSKMSKNVKKCQIMSKFVKRIIFTLFSLLSHGCPGIFRDGTGCQNPGLAHPKALEKLLGWI